MRKQKKSLEAWVVPFIIVGGTLLSLVFGSIGLIGISGFCIWRNAQPD